MRFGYLETMTDPQFMKPLAIAAEEAGYDAFVIPDSIGYPEECDSRYPYTADGDRAFLEDKPFIEPLVLIPYLAGVTETIRFTTSVVKLPLRHPVLLAKQVSSAAVLSGGRISLGVGLSPWPEDYAAVDVPWKGRGRRLDEMLDIIQGLCAGGYFAYPGEVFKVASMKICPVPEKPIPIIIGGHSEPALRRGDGNGACMARRGDGASRRWRGSTARHRADVDSRPRSNVARRRRREGKTRTPRTHFLSSPQKTWTIERVAAVTGSLKSPPGGETAPMTVTVPSRVGEPRHSARPARS